MWAFPDLLSRMSEVICGREHERHQGSVGDDCHCGGPPSGVCSRRRALEATLIAAVERGRRGGRQVVERPPAHSHTDGELPGQERPW